MLNTAFRYRSYRDQGLSIGNKTAKVVKRSRATTKATRISRHGIGISVRHLKESVLGAHVIEGVIAFNIEILEAAA